MSAGHGRLPFPWPRWGCRYGQGGQGRRGSAGLGDATLAQVPPLPLGISPRCVPGPPPVHGMGGDLGSVVWQHRRGEGWPRPDGVQHRRKPGKPGLFSLAKRGLRRTAAVCTFLQEGPSGDRNHRESGGIYI